MRLFYLILWQTITFTTAASNISGTISPAAASFCAGGSQLLTASAGSSYQWLRNDTLIAGANASTYLATDSGTYKVLITNGSCSLLASNTALITVNVGPAPGTAEWLGAADGDWNNAANWKCGITPGTTLAVIIKSGMAHYPVITSNTTVKSLQADPGTSVTVGAGIVLTIIDQ